MQTLSERFELRISLAERSQLAELARLAGVSQANALRDALRLAYETRQAMAARTATKNARTQPTQQQA